jgi:cyclic dehypoxanthinyl futalosine synthase
VIPRTRLAAPPLLSARPFTYGIESGAVPGFDLMWADAVACVEYLDAGTVDLVLLPTVHYARLQSGLRLVPGIAATVDLAVGSAFAPAFASECSPAPVVDDVDQWRTRTGLPFVSLVWAGRPGAIDPVGAAALERSLRLGLSHRQAIARDHASANAGDQSDAESFLASLSYRLGAQELAGLAAFVERVLAARGEPKRSLVRLFDFAYAPERPDSLPRSSSRAAASRSVDSLLADAAAGRRLSPDQGLRLHEQAPLLELGSAADQRRQSLHPGNRVTYIIDRNVNYTNLCVTACKFCNFYRPVSKSAALTGDASAYSSRKNDGYTLSRAQLAEKFEETVSLGGIQILLQGGVNPNLRLTYYEDLFRWIKANFALALHALSPEEVSFIAKLEGLSIGQVLERLVAAGLDSLPGGGAEILDDEIRHRISPLKCTTDTWLAVMREAHALGLRTTSTMVFGFGENPGHIVRHLERLRALQDQTAGFTAFICWPFQAEGTRLKLSDDTSAHRYLRTFALARLYLDNIPNLQVSWPTMGPAIGQVALRFGGNDFGSAMIEENVVSQAGAVFKLSAADIERCVIRAGFVPRRRNMRYELCPESDTVATQVRLPAPVAA